MLPAESIIRDASLKGKASKIMELGALRLRMLARRTFMNRRPALLATALLAVISSTSLAVESWKRESRPFAPNGTVEVRMPVGDIHISQASNEVFIRYGVKPGTVADNSRVQLRFDIKKSTARIEFDASVGTNIDAEVGVPSPSNLRVHLESGYVRLDDLPGNREVSVGVGDIGVKLCPKPDDEYRAIAVYTHLGSILESGLGQIDGWFGKSLQHRGEGNYRMELRTGIGNIELRSTPFPSFPAQN